MSLTLGKSFNRQLKLRIPFKNYFYDIGIFYTTKINFNLFDIKPILKYNIQSAPNDVKINMFKNIEMSIFCSECLDLGEENNRISYFKCIKEEWRDIITLDNVEHVNMGIDNEMTIFMFVMNQYSDSFRFILTERKNITKVSNEHIIRTLSGIQISTTKPIELMNASIIKNFDS